MSLVKINSFAEYKQIVERFGLRGCLKNDYLQSEADDLIAHRRLQAILGQDNAILLRQMDGFHRIYYYVNNVSELLTLPEEELMTEILFRGETAPDAEVKWLESMGFCKNLVRDQYFARYSSLKPSDGNGNTKIAFAQNKDEVSWAVNLFNKTFDKWSGDYIPSDKHDLLLAEQSILLAKDENGLLLGALHLENKKGVWWLNHITVVPEARGKKVGLGLLEAYIEQGHSDNDSRYMLWVQRQNVAAVTMYRNKGFMPMNKSTLSMIRK